MLTQRESQRGFSLVELLVGIALLAVILRIAIPGFSTMIQNSQVRAAAESVLDGVQLARTEAVRRNRNVKFELQPGNGWQVGCETVDTTVVAGEQVCPAMIQARAGSDGTPSAVITTAQVNASTNADDTSPAFTTTLAFSSLGRVTPATLPVGKLAHFRMTSATGGNCAAAGGEMRCLTVVVGGGGQVRMCDPATTSPDPRAC